MSSSIQVGDLVRYREWQPGDPKVEDVLPSRRSWGMIGIVVEIEDWTRGGEKYFGEGVVVLDENADFMHAHRDDLEILKIEEKSAV